MSMNNIKLSIKMKKNIKMMNMGFFFFLIIGNYINTREKSLVWMPCAVGCALRDFGCAFTITRFRNLTGPGLNFCAYLNILGPDQPS